MIDSSTSSWNSQQRTTQRRLSIGHSATNTSGTHRRQLHHGQQQKRSLSSTSASCITTVRRCLGKIVAILYTQILVAIFVSVAVTIYRSSSILKTAQEEVASAPSELLLAEGGQAPLPPSNDHLGGQSPEALDRERALQRSAKETADAEKNKQRELERNDNNNNNEDGVEDTSMHFVQPTDFIYQDLPGEAAPIVLEEHKLIFFAQAKVGCTVWKMLFRRILGYPDWYSTDHGLPHIPSLNGLRYLYHYNLTYASHIMTAPDWTRAVFTRDPKERFLSAYLDKGVEDLLFLGTCCNRQRQVYCDVTPPSLPDFMTSIHTCKDSHWDPQNERMEAKYWPYINFVGHMETVQEDAKGLLQQLNIWEHFGLTGWGKHQQEAVFAGKEGNSHASNAKSKVDEYLYPELELEVEDFYKGDYESPWLNLSVSSRKFKDTSLPEIPVDHASLDLPIVEPRDWIYRTSRTDGEAAPIVIEKYKLIFFAVPHVAENEFKRLFRRMLGFNDWKTRVYDRKNPLAINKGLAYLRDFNLTQASHMMTSPDWTRALFVRDPKERFALSYTQTAVRNRALLHEICCMNLPRQFCLKGTTTRALLDVPTSVEFFAGISSCKSTQWDPMTERLGALTRLGINVAQKRNYDPKMHAKNKYWKYINFVGNVGNQEDGKLFLDRLDAWTDFGGFGWADSPSDLAAGRDSFLGTTNFLKAELKAKKHVQQVIKDPQMERQIEQFYEQDYKMFNLTKLLLYSSQGDTYGKAVNRQKADVRKGVLESTNAAQRQW